MSAGPKVPTLAVHCLNLHPPVADRRARTDGQYISKGSTDPGHDWWSIFDA